jgi:nitrogen fixation protein NifX
MACGKGEIKMWRVAAASSDGKYVNQHFGRATQFLIFDLEEDGGHRFVELRSNQPSCSWETAEEPEAPKHGQTIGILADCQAVLVSRIGAAAEATLNAHGIKAFVIPNFIDEALGQVAKELAVAPPA